MFEIKVYIGEKGDVVLEQPCWGSDDSIIVISKDQIDILIQWLNQAKDELNDKPTD